MIKRDKWIHVKVAEAERKSWQDMAQAQGVTLADLIRQRMGDAAEVGREPKRRKRLTKKADPELLRHLSRIGNNLNQIAGWVNTRKEWNGTISILTHLVAIERAVLSFLPTAPSPEGVEDSDHAD